MVPEQVGGMNPSMAPMIGKKRQLITYELVEFEEKPVEVQGCMKLPIIIEKSIDYTSN